MCQLGSTVPNRRNGKFDRAADTPTIEKLARQVGGIVSVKDRLARVILASPNNSVTGPVG